MALSESERITILMMRGYGNLTRSFQEVADLYNEENNLRPPISKSTVVRTVHRFQETGSVKDLPRSGRPKSVSGDDKAIEVLQAFVEDPHNSTRKAAQQLDDISKSSIHRILKSNKYHPYKVRLVHELSEDDFDRRVEYCELMMTKIENDENFINNVVFSDEASFMLNGTVNRHNCRYWADDNPHWMREAHTQYPEKINVWAGIFRDQIIGPFFIEENLNRNNYHQLLLNEVVPAIEAARDENHETWFQQDGAPPHFGINVRTYLDGTFPRRWIGRRGAIEWPARSPDLTPLDYFLWGYLKSKVYTTKPQNLIELRQRITHEAQQIPGEMIQNVVQHYYYRLAHCVTVEGKQFEHLL